MDRLQIDQYYRPIQDKKGNYLFTDDKGNEFYRPEQKEKIDEVVALAKKLGKEEEEKERKNQEEKKLSQQKEAKKMADENITKFDVLKEKVENIKEDTKNKFQERENFDKELEQKVKALDDKVCHGEECYNRIEKGQQESYKSLEERLKKLEEPIYVCSNCGIGTMRRGQTECPYCGVKVKTWN